MIGKTFLRLERDFDKHVKYCRDAPVAQEFLASNDAIRDFFMVRNMIVELYQLNHIYTADTVTKAILEENFKLDGADGIALKASSSVKHKQLYLSSLPLAPSVGIKMDYARFGKHT